MLNLKGSNNDAICNSYAKQKNSNEIKLVNNYIIVFLNKETNWALSLFLFLKEVDETSK